MQNTSQFLDLTPTQMLALWRQLLHLNPLRDGVTITRTDGIDLDALLLRHIQQWYATQLATAPVALLPVQDVAAQVQLTTCEGVVTATPPAHAVRPVEWQLSGWSHPVTTFEPASSPLALRQLNPFTRAGQEQPVVVQHATHLVLYSASSRAPQLLQAWCVVHPTGGNFLFHSQLLSTIPQWEQSHPGLM